MFDIDDYNYELPVRLIAQVPPRRRDQSRLLMVDRRRQSFSDHFFSDLPALLRPGDLLIVNDTKVVPARLFGRKETGGRIEIVVLDQPHSTHGDPNTRLCMLKSSKGPKSGMRLHLDAGVSGVISELRNDGLVRIAFDGDCTIDSLMEKAGRMPLPPYIRRGKNGAHDRLDRERYQTVFGNKPGAVAAPTAGLHFTKTLVSKLERMGIATVSLTLHVGHGTFQPVRTKDIRDHQLAEEYYTIDASAAEAVHRIKASGGRVVAVGTTAVRALETAVEGGGGIRAGSGCTGLLITPGHRFQVVDGLITNFHLPKSSLLFLVSAFLGLEKTRQAYQWAIDREYRFYSYGDAMLVL